MIILKDATCGNKKRKGKGVISGSLYNTGKGGIRPPTVKLGDKNIKYSHTVRYLGVHFGTRLTVNEHIKRVRAKGKQVFHQMGAIVRNTWGLQFSSMQSVYGCLLQDVSLLRCAGRIELSLMTQHIL